MVCTHARMLACMHLMPHARTSQVKDAELNFAVLSQLLGHPKAILAKFPFPLLPMPNQADQHEVRVGLGAQVVRP